MEQKDVQNVEKEKTTENADTQTAEEKEVKTFKELLESNKSYQDEFNTIIQDRLKKAKKDIPSEEDLKAFNDWRESQKTETEKQAEQAKKYADKENENIALKQENKVLRSGVSDEDVDYVVFKVSKMEGDFEDNLEEFLKENPKYLQKEEVTETPKTTGVAVTKIKDNEESGVMAILKAKHPDAFK